MTKLHEYVHHTYVWVKRFRHRRGWSVQSPFAFRFIKEVLFANPKHPAYATLAHIRRAHGINSWARYDRLLLRLAAFAQPKTAVIFGQNAAVVSQYVKAGHSSAEVFDETEDIGHMLTQMAHLSHIDYAYIDADQHAAAFAEAAIRKAHAGSVIIIRHINRTPYMKQLWQCLEEDPRTVVTFDLYYLGIVLFRQGLSKEAHKVCF